MKHLMIRVLCALTATISLAGSAWAQELSAEVTYRPLNLMSVPMLSSAAMVLLGVLLAFIAWRVGRSGKWMTRVSGIAILTITAAVSFTVGVKNIHAIALGVPVGDVILIQGDECNVETTEGYDANAPSATLTSTCGNPVEVVSVVVTADCNLVNPVAGACEEGSKLGSGDSCALPVCEQVVVAGDCQAGAVKLSTSPGGDMVVCDDPADATCEQDVETLCPVGWQLCSYQQHGARNEGWTYPLSSAGNTVVAEIYCRPNSGAGHFTMGPYSAPSTLGDDIPFNCGYGSSRQSCTSDYGCNEQYVQALCCQTSPSCGNGVVDSPEEECDDGNQDESDACLNSCSIRQQDC